VKFARWIVALAVAGAVVTGCRRQESSQVSRDQVRSPKEWLAQESISLLRDYVRIPTRSELEGEEAGALFLKEFFDCANIEAEIVCPAPGRCNVLARLPGLRRDGALLLLNHIDVANVFPEGWREGRPFEGDIKNGYLYGRGVFDTKSLAIVQALAMRHLKEHGIVPRSDILFLAESDEEWKQQWGSRWLLSHRPEWFEGVTAVFNEGGASEVIVRDVRFWGIETVQAGCAWAELESPDAKPLEELAARWTRLHSPVVEPNPQVVEGFRLLANELHPPLNDLLRNLDRVRRDPEELSGLPDRFAVFLEARVQWLGPVHPPNDGSAKFHSMFYVYVPPGMDPAPYVKSILDDASRSGVRAVSVFQSGSTEPSPYPTPTTMALQRVIEGRYPGTWFGPLPTVGGFTTSILFQQKGFAAYGFSPIPMNRFDASRRHGNDERVYLRDYVNGVDLFRDFLEEFAFFAESKSSLSRAGT
jgi:acetylornithine deacetylase/succinyl-diaminopimelate desuccinylase-like protein